MNRFMVLLALLALGLGVAACGDEDDPADSGDDFVAALNSICEEQTQAIIDNNLERGYATEQEDLLESAQTLTEIRTEASAQIEELEPPEEAAGDFKELVAARQDQVAASEDREKATQAGSEEAIAKAGAAFEEANEAENRVSAELGADVCDEELPEADAQAAEDALREFSTTDDPATSCDPDELVTETYLENALGGVEKCEQTQVKFEEKPEDLPDDISVDKVSGVDGLAAIIEYSDVGGMFDGEPARATLYNLDGGWKIYEIAAAE